MKDFFTHLIDFLIISPSKNVTISGYSSVRFCIFRYPHIYAFCSSTCWNTQKIIQYLQKQIVKCICSNLFFINERTNNSSIYFNNLSLNYWKNLPIKFLYIFIFFHFWFLIIKYGGRRLYQYNEDNFWFPFLYQALKQHGYWTHKTWTKGEAVKKRFSL